MCDVVTALKIGTAIYSHQSKRAIAKGQMRANEQTRRNSDQAYLNDIAKIDREAVSASREKVAEDFRISQEKIKKQAQALNLNAGNGDKIVQDIAGTYDMQFLDVARDYEMDVLKIQDQTGEAYAAQQRRYNSIKPVSMPSNTGLLLSVATAGAEGYQNYQAGQSSSKALFDASNTSTYASTDFGDYK
jgi:hypothetical protein